MLAKTDALFEDEREHRDRDQSDLDWLEHTSVRTRSSNRSDHRRPRTLGQSTRA